MNGASSTTRVVSESGGDVGPGERLREAREAARLTVGEVASRLRLTPNVVERLEADDYERLHGATFVRGYLSGYARLLDLPEGPILEAYERHGHGPPALVSELGHKPEVHVSDFPVRMVTYVIAGLLVVLVVLWWQSRQLDTSTDSASSSLVEDAAPAASDGPRAQTAPAPTRDPMSGDASAPLQVPVAAQAPLGDPSAGTPGEPPAAQSSQPADAVASAAPTPTPSGEAPATEAGARDASASAGGADTPLPGAEPVLRPEDESGETAPPIATRASSDEDGAEVAADGERAQLAAASENASDAASAPVAPPAPLPGSDILAIQLSRESWIEIYDRGGGRLYYSLAREGSEIVVEGAGPMRVLLGEVEGAAVAYNGEPYDLSRYKGRSVVRFTVGEPSASPAQESPAPSAAEEPLTRELEPPAQAEQDDPVVDAGAAIEGVAAQVPATGREASAEPSLPQPPLPDTAPPASGPTYPDP